MKWSFTRVCSSQNNHWQFFFLVQMRGSFRWASHSLLEFPSSMNAVGKIAALRIPWSFLLPHRLWFCGEFLLHDLWSCLPGQREAYHTFSRRENGKGCNASRRWASHPYQKLMRQSRRRNSCFNNRLWCLRLFKRKTPETHCTKNNKENGILEQHKKTVIQT